MLAEHSPDENDQDDAPKKRKTSEPASAVRTALQCAYSVLQSRIISDPNDMMGILLFGTEQTRFKGDASGGFAHCYLLMDLDVPDAEGIKELKGLLEDEDNYSAVVAPSKEKVSMANVLFGANQIFTTKAANFQSRKLFVITDDDDPHSDDKALKNSAITRARDLYDLGVQIDPFYISNPGSKAGFDPSKFYDDIIYRPAHEDADDYPLPVTNNGTTRLKEMVTSIRSKATAKRAQFSTRLELGPGFSIGVKGYIIFKKQEKGRSHYIYTSGERPQIVKGVTTIISDEAARVVEKNELKKAYKFGGEQVAFTELEMKEMRKFEDPVIRIIGFKPRSSLRFDWNVKVANFIYPDEKDFIGSTRTFTALHSMLVKLDKIGLVWCITRRNASPVLCALYPSVEIIEKGTQVNPPGFYLIQLPFADDIRQNPETSSTRAPAALIDKMRAVVRQLHLAHAYDPEKYQNPSLQWHYRILQAIALDEDLPEQPEDNTLPKYKAIHKNAGMLVKEWGEELEKYDIAPVDVPMKGRKRVTAGGDDSATKKAKTAGGGGVDVRGAYEKGTLGKLTVAQLKEFMKTAGLDTVGKKAELVEKVESYFDKK
jgi:ATP-dependent DNA helicase 2 subunit 1